MLLTPHCRVSEGDSIGRMETIRNPEATVTMYTTSWCPDCEAAKRYLTDKGVEFREVDIEDDETAAELVASLNGGKRSVPTLVAGGVAASLSRFSPKKAHEFLLEAGLKHA